MGSNRARLFIGLALALTLVVSACGGDDDDDDDAATEEAGDDGGGDGEGSIWVLLPDTASSERWEADDRRFFTQYFEEAGLSEGSDFTIVNAEGDASTQQAQAEQAIADGASVILLTSLDTGSGATIIDTAKDAGVDVVEYDRFNTGGSGGAAYVSFDNVQVGQRMAEILEPVIDALPPTPQVVMLNGGEEDNNSFLFKAGYAETVEAKVAEGAWALAADQHVPEWDNQQAQTIMEQILVDAGNDVDAVFAANDGLAQSTINAVQAAGIGPIPISGQDATAPGIQNVLLGLQTMTVYKPIEAEAGVAAAVALALRNGDDPTAIESEFDFTIIGITAEDGQPADSPDGDGVVPYFALVPIGVTVDNIADTVIADGFRTVEEICTGDVAETEFCQSTTDAVNPLADAPLLECRGVSKAFGAVRALHRVDFEVRYGEVMALVGDNGAGKSTLIKGVAGIYPFDEGQVRFDDQSVHIHSPREAARLGIEVVYQDLALADNLDVVGNMFLGRERTRGFVLDESSMERTSRETLDSLSVTTLRSVRQTVAGLSGGQRQAIAVAKSVMWNSRLVILDEPTAALGVRRRAKCSTSCADSPSAGWESCSSRTTCTTSSRPPIGSPCCGSARSPRCSKSPRRPRRRSCTRSPQEHCGGCPAWATRSARRGRGMTGPSDVDVATEEPETFAETLSAPMEHETFLGYVGRWWQGVHAGELGSLPIIVGLVVIALVFGLLDDTFFTERNFTNLLLQMAAPAIIAIGVVFVLLIGEIDLSVAYVSAVGGVLTALLLRPGDPGWPWWIVLPVALGATTLIGFLQAGVVTKAGVPSFVVTLAGLLVWNGVVLYLTVDYSSAGTIRIQDSTVIGIANNFLSDAWGWIIAGVVVAFYAVSQLHAARARPGERALREANVGARRANRRTGGSHVGGGVVREPAIAACRK